MKVNSCQGDVTGISAKKITTDLHQWHKTQNYNYLKHWSQYQTVLVIRARAQQNSIDAELVLMIRTRQTSVKGKPETSDYLFEM